MLCEGMKLEWHTCESSSGSCAQCSEITRQILKALKCQTADFIISAILKFIHEGMNHSITICQYFCNKYLDYLCSTHEIQTNYTYKDADHKYNKKKKFS